MISIHKGICDGDHLYILGIVWKQPTTIERFTYSWNACAIQTNCTVVIWYKLRITNQTMDISNISEGLES